MTAASAMAAMAANVFSQKLDFWTVGSRSLQPGLHHGLKGLMMPGLTSFFPQTCFGLSRNLQPGSRCNLTWIVAMC